MKRLGLATAGALLLLGGGWFCIPGPSHLVETLQSSCRLTDGSTVRFYEGNGGATTAYWYLITAQTGRWPWTERTVFFAYAEPIVAGVTCEGDVLTVAATEGRWSLSASDLADRDRRPILYYRGQPEPNLSYRGNWGPLEMMRTALGVFSCAAGLWLLWLAWRM